ncbi:MAG: hypothetical protein HC915_19490 [Anaerolineae bacterium]|nr:hypothetical protein [Anaerolineae bacterium]
MAPGELGGADYLPLLQASYTSIKAANPNTLVISGAPTPTGAAGLGQTSCSQNPSVCNDDVWYRELAEAGGGQYMDCIGAHYNEGILPPTATSGDPRDVDYATRYFEANTERAWQPFEEAGYPDLPVCYTELGYLTSEGYGPLPPEFSWAVDTSVAEQASWLATAALMSAQSGRVMMMIVWNLDFDNYESGPAGPDGGLCHHPPGW